MLQGPHIHSVSQSILYSFIHYFIREVLVTYVIKYINKEFVCLNSATVTSSEPLFDKKFALTTI